MNDCIEIGTDWIEAGIEIDGGFDNGVSFEGGFDIMLEAVAGDESEIHLVIADIVDESEADNTAYDFETEFSAAPMTLVYVGPVLPTVEVEWSTDAWFHSDAWFRSEAW